MSAIGDGEWGGGSNVKHAVVDNMNFFYFFFEGISFM